MKKAFLVLVLASVPMPSLALYKERSFVIGAPQAYAKRADRIADKRGAELEKILKRELVVKKFKNPSVFKDLVEDPEKRRNSPAMYLSFVDEVNEALINRQQLNSKGRDPYSLFEGSKIDLAKRIAKQQMYFAIKTNWPSIKQVDEVADNWTAASALILEKMAGTFNYLPQNSTADNYVFEFEDWGYVEINKKNLRRGRVIIRKASNNDYNRPEPGAEQIRADSDGEMASVVLPRKLEAPVSPPPAPPKVSAPLKPKSAAPTNDLPMQPTLPTGDPLGDEFFN